MTGAASRTRSFGEPIRIKVLDFCATLIACLTWTLSPLAWSAEVQGQTPENPSRIVASAGSSVLIANPVDYFRSLLSETPQNREQMLAQKPPAQRQRLLDKIKEYEAMSIQERELRLQATRLRWQLISLMRTAPSNRVHLLASLPEHERRSLENRLNQWDLLSPAVQNVLLQGPTTSASQQPSFSRSPDPVEGAASRSLDRDIARWNSTPVEHRHKILTRFQQFFELTTSEKEKTLSLLETGQRQQVEATVQAWQALPSKEREKHVTFLKKFTDLPPVEQDRYRKLAEEWNRLQPDGRQAVQYFMNEIPPIPPGMPRPQLPGFMPNPASTAAPPAMLGVPAPRPTNL